MSQIPGVEAEKLAVPTGARSIEEPEGKLLLKHWKELKMRRA